MTTDNLEFTGERFIPRQTDPVLALEHYHRYLYASRFTRKKRVLDIACGEGYGAAFLSLNAREVVGIDNDEKTISLARAKYTGMANLRFEVGRCEDFEVPSRNIDVAVSFETIEHISAEVQEQFLTRITHALKPDGILLISSPERGAYDTFRPVTNEFHKHELSDVEFFAMLKQHFSHVVVLGQRPVTLSAIWSLHEWADDSFHFHVRKELFKEPKDVEKFTKPIYLIAACSNEPFPPDVAEESKSMYYDIDEIDRVRNIHGWALELQKEVEQLRAHVGTLQQEYEQRTEWAKNLAKESEDRNTLIAQLQKELEQRTTWAKKLEKENTDHNGLIVQLQKEVEERTAWAKKLEKENADHNGRIVQLQKEVEERTAWAKKLEKESADRNARIVQWQKEVEDRTAWAQSLDKENGEQKEYVGKLQMELQERTTWAKSLHEEVERIRTFAVNLQKDLEDARTRLIAAERKSQEAQLWGSMAESQLNHVTASPVYRLLAAIGLLPKRNG